LRNEDDQRKDSEQKKRERGLGAKWRQTNGPPLPSKNNKRKAFGREKTERQNGTENTIYSGRVFVPQHSKRGGKGVSRKRGGKLLKKKKGEEPGNADKELPKEWKKNDKPEN